MKNSKKSLIISLVCAAFLCSIVVIVSESGRIFSESKEVPPEIPDLPEELSPLASHEEAISITSEFLNNVLGDEFFKNHFEFVEVDERPSMPTTWFVLYQYTSNGHTINMSVAVYCGRIPKSSSRVDRELSDVILEPQEILILEEKAKIIAQENGLEPPYKITLVCDFNFHTICWTIMKEDRENLDVEDLAGVLIDAENGTVLEKWIKGRLA